DALPSAPESAEIKRYISACDTEVHARGALQSAERAAASRRFAEAIKALDAVDSDSLIHDDAVKRRKELAPKAAAEDVEAARAVATVREPTPKRPVGRPAPAAKEDEPAGKTKEPAATPVGKLDAPASPQALTAYKTRDFATAERLYRMEARNQSLKRRRRRSR